MDNINNTNITNSTTPDTTSTPGADSTAAKLSMFPEGYLNNGYQNNDVKYITDYAEAIADTLRPKMNPEVLVRIYRKVDNLRYDFRKGSKPCPEIDFEAVKRELAKLLPYTASLVDKGKAPVILQEFMEANITAVTDTQTYLAFRDHLEAVTGYTNR